MASKIKVLNRSDAVALGSLEVGDFFYFSGCDRNQVRIVAPVRLYNPEEENILVHYVTVGKNSYDWAEPGNLVIPLELVAATFQERQ